MAMDLTEADRKNILDRVDTVNNYHVTLNNDIIQMTKLQKKLISRNMNNYQQVSKLLDDYQLNHNENYSYGVGNEIANYNDSFNKSLALPNQYLTNSKRNDKKYHYSYNMKLKDTYHEYQKLMLGVIYGYLYKTYGKNIPKNLDQYINYSDIIGDSHMIFDELEKWWDNNTSKSIREYGKENDKDIFDRFFQAFRMLKNK